MSQSEERKRRLLNHLSEQEGVPSGTSATATVPVPVLPSQTVLKRLANHLVSLDSSNSPPAQRLYDRVTGAILRHFCQIMEVAVDIGASKRQVFELCINEVRDCG
jgi:hypothetical protein